MADITSPGKYWEVYKILYIHKCLSVSQIYWKVNYSYETVRNILKILRKYGLVYNKGRVWCISESNDDIEILVGR